MTINNFTFFSPTGTEFPVSSNADAKLYTMLTGMELNTFRRKDWTEPTDTALNRQYTNTSLVVGGRYFELEGETVELQASSDNFVHANIDLTNTSAPVSISVEAADNSNSVDINNGTGVLKQCFDIVTTDSMGVTSQRVPEQVTKVDKLETSYGNVYGSKSEGAWYEERLAPNFYRWTRIMKINTAVTGGYRGIGYISAAQSFPALPTGAVAQGKSSTAVAPSNSGTWTFPDGGNTYRIFNTASIASGSFTVLLTVYGNK